MNPNTTKIKQHLRSSGFLQSPGAYVLVDGQFGSTGKGLAAAMLAEMFHDKVVGVTSNAGPNSGHTSYHDGEKIVLCQLPTFGVIANRMGSRVHMYLNAGAVIDPERLTMEADKYANIFNLWVHPVAAVTSTEGREVEGKLTKDIGSTGKGTGAAIAAKVMRDPSAVFGGSGVLGNFLAGSMPHEAPEYGVVFVEVSQGFSLSLNASGMYPFTTSRDCTVGQALSDANIHPSFLRQTMMVVRTFPIRVAGNSGPCYEDQREMTWEELGVEPEITTVTKKVRRVFTWSDQQFREAVLVNRPEHLFVNFCNYLKPSKVRMFVQNIIDNYIDVMGHSPLSVLMGFGPNADDVVLWEEE
jgi:adenylosuccinate synthase